jgi:hypothetical protein
LLERVQFRTDNPYGKTEDQRAEVRLFTRTVEPRLRRIATLERDGRRPVAELADVIEQLLAGTG